MNGADVSSIAVSTNCIACVYRQKLAKMSNSRGRLLVYASGIILLNCFDSVVGQASPEIGAVRNSLKRGKYHSIDVLFIVNSNSFNEIALTSLHMKFDKIQDIIFSNIIIFVRFVSKFEFFLTSFILNELIVRT